MEYNRSKIVLSAVVASVLAMGMTLTRVAPAFAEEPAGKAKVEAAKTDSDSDTCDHKDCKKCKKCKKDKKGKKKCHCDYKKKGKKMKDEEAKEDEKNEASEKSE